MMSLLTELGILRDMAGYKYVAPLALRLAAECEPYQICVHLRFCRVPPARIRTTLMIGFPSPPPVRFPKLIKRFSLRGGNECAGCWWVAGKAGRRSIAPGAL